MTILDFAAAAFLFTFAIVFSGIAALLLVMLRERLTGVSTRDRRLLLESREEHAHRTRAPLRVVSDEPLAPVVNLAAWRRDGAA